MLTIRDVIHGNIHLDEFETLVVDTPYFQRLRHINQLGFLNYVFPSANHSRFEHAIGTMELSTRMLKSIAFNQTKLFDMGDYFLNDANPSLFNLKIFEQTRLFQSEEKQPAVAENKSIIQTLLNEHNLKVLRLAALLHDVGHGPFSHATEHLASKIDIGQILKIDLPPFIKTYFQKKEESRDSLRHESVTLLIAYYIFDHIEKQGSGKQKKLNLSSLHGLLQDVLCLIDKDIEPSGASPLRKHNVYLFLRTLLSGEIDADRMDYLLRDSYYTGVKYGLFDSNRLLDSIYFYIDDDGVPQLSIAKDGVLSFEDYLFRRYQMYIQIYMHRGNVGMEGTLKHIASYIEHLRYPIEREEWLSFNDYTFKDWFKKQIGDNDYLLDMIEAVFRRKGWKLIFEDVDFLKKNSNFDAFCDILEEKMGGKFFAQSDSQYISRFRPFENDFEVGIKILSRSMINRTYDFEDMSQYSYLANSLRKTIQIKRIYVNPAHFEEAKGYLAQIEEKGP